MIVTLDSVSIEQIDRQGGRLFGGLWYYHEFAAPVSNNSIIEFARVDRETFQAEFVPPINCSSVSLRFQTCEANVGKKQFFLPIIAPDGSVLRNTNTQQLLRADEEHYMVYFEQERNLFPDNIGVYAARWQQEMDLRLIDTSALRSEILSLREHHAGHPFLAALNLIAAMILGDDDAAERLSDLMQLEDGSWANHPSIVALVSSILRSHPDYNKICGHVMSTFPQSQFTYFRCFDGTVRSVDTTTAFVVLDTMSRRYDYAYFTYRQSSIRRYLESGPDESLLTAYNKTLNWYHQDCGLRVRQDPTGLMSRLEFQIWQEAAHVLHKLGQTRQALVYLDSAAAALPAFDSRNAFVYKEMGDVYSEMGKTDSALSLYSVSHVFSPDFAPVADSLNSFYSNHYRGRLTYDEFNDSLYRTAAARRRKVPDLFPLIVLEDNVNLDLRQAGDNIYVVEFVSASCSACIQNMQEMTLYKAAPDSRKDVVYIAAGEDVSAEIDQMMRENNLRDFAIANNGAELIEFLGIQTFPVTLIVGKYGEICYYIEGGGGNIDLLAKLDRL